MSKDTAAVKRKVNSLPVGDKISIIRQGGPEVFATFISEETDGFTSHDVDTDINVHLAFTEVKKVKDGYGTTTFCTIDIPSLFGHRCRSDHLRQFFCGGKAWSFTVTRLAECSWTAGPKEER
jgi:hypothetical protein